MNEFYAFIINKSYKLEIKATTKHRKKAKLSILRERVNQFQEISGIVKEILGRKIT